MNLTAGESVQKGNGQVSAQYYNVFMLLVSCFSFVKQTTGKSTENHEDRRYSWMLYIYSFCYVFIFFRTAEIKEDIICKKEIKKAIT